MQTYRVIGGDQKEYGPVTADEVRRWIAEGRLNGQSQLWTDGASGWQPLAVFPEFADALRAQAGGSVPPPGEPMPPLSTEIWRQQILSSQPQLRIGDCIARSLKIVTSHFGLIFSATFLVWILGVASSLVPGGGLLYWALRGVLYGGLYLVFLGLIRGRRTAVGEVFSGFNIAFAQLVLVGIISALLTVCGMCCFVIPGIYLFVAWTFSVPLVADRRLEFWTAMELSRKVVSRVWFEALVLLVLIFLPTILMHFFVQGKIATNIIPILRQQMESARPPDLARIFALGMQIAKNNFLLIISSKLVLLLNLPFAIGALACAYEDLFGTRTTRAS